MPEVLQNGLKSTDLLNTLLRTVIVLKCQWQVANRRSAKQIYKREKKTKKPLSTQILIKKTRIPNISELDHPKIIWQIYQYPNGSELLVQISFNMFQMKKHCHFSLPSYSPVSD